MKWDETTEIKELTDKVLELEALNNELGMKLLDAEGNFNVLSGYQTDCNNENDNEDFEAVEVNMRTKNTLTKEWASAVDRAIKDVDGDDNPPRADCFREIYAQNILDCVHGPTPTPAEAEEIQDSYVSFIEGWNAAIKYLARRGQHIAQWVRIHGAPTGSLDQKEGVVTGYIIRKTDLSRLEKAGRPSGSE